MNRTLTDYGSKGAGQKKKGKSVNPISRGLNNTFTYNEGNQINVKNNNFPANYKRGPVREKWGAKDRPTEKRGPDLSYEKNTKDRKRVGDKMGKNFGGYNSKYSVIIAPEKLKKFKLNFGKKSEPLIFV
jgi:hypothetical protein